jgi:hypothetical protein
VRAKNCAAGVALDSGGGGHIGWGWSAAFCVLAASNLTSIVLLPLLTWPHAPLPAAVPVGARAYRHSIAQGGTR